MNANQPELKAAVIGLGFIGAGDPVSGEAIGQSVSNLDGTHAQALAAHPRVRLVAGASRDEGRRNRFEQRLGVANTYADWHKMLASETLDIVSVATYSPYHAEITMACAEAGVRAVLCEKPIATRLSDADRMIETCRANGTILAVNHNRRWHPLWRRLRDEIQSDALGEVYQAAIHWSSGRLGNVGTHWFDALRLLLAAEPIAVSGRLDPEAIPDCRGPAFHDPGGWGVVDFSNGVKAFIHARAAGSLPLRLRIMGSRGELTIAGADAHIALWNGEKRAISVSEDRPDSMVLAVRDLVEALEKGRPALSTGADGRQALEIIMGFHASDRLNGQWIDLPLTGADRDRDVKIG